MISVAQGAAEPKCLYINRLELFSLQRELSLGMPVERFDTRGGLKAPLVEQILHTPNLQSRILLPEVRVHARLCSLLLHTFGRFA